MGTYSGKAMQGSFGKAIQLRRGDTTHTILGISRKRAKITPQQVHDFEFLQETIFG
jgi:hypothetical protein